MFSALVQDKIVSGISLCGPRKQWFWNKDYGLQREIEITVTTENIKLLEKQKFLSYYSKILHCITLS